MYDQGIIINSSNPVIDEGGMLLRSSVDQEIIDLYFNQPIDYFYV